MFQDIICNIYLLISKISPETWIALFSFIVALITLWITLVSPARISIKIGNTVAVYFSDYVRNGKTERLLSICIPLDILNKGARSGTIRNLALRVKFGEEENKYIFKASREISEIQVDTMPNDHNNVDTKKMQSKLGDPFTSITLTGKTRSHKNYIFCPIHEKALSISINPPFVISLELLVQTDSKWKKHETISFKNDHIRIDEGNRWGLFETCESLGSLSKLEKK